MILHTDLSVELHQIPFGNLYDWYIEYQCSGDYCPFAGECPDGPDSDVLCNHPPSMIAALEGLKNMVEGQLEELRGGKK